MNREKARDFFSSYTEGTLDAGLTHSLEQRMRQDPETKADYEAFKHTFEDLNALRFVSAPVPDDLHEKISARLDLQAWEQKRAKSTGWSGWLRNVALGGVAGAAVLGAVLSLVSHGSASTSSLVSGFTANQLQAVPVDKGVRVTYLATNPRSVTVQSADRVLRVDRLASNQRWDSTLINSQPLAASFQISVSDESTPMEIVVPGTAGSHAKLGRGSVEDLAKALADNYRVPVILTGKDFTQMVKWEFPGQDVSEAAGSALSNRSYTVEVKNGNALWISQN